QGGRDPDERVATHAGVGEGGVRGGGQVGHQPLRRPWMRLNTVGTKNSVATVAKTSPPITARPSGAFCSPPSPRPVAMGTIPMIIAKAVMMTGRIRTKPASTAALWALLPSFICSRANDTIKILLAVATPIHIIAPVREGTLNVVCVNRSIQQMPASAPGRAVMMMKGSSQDWKFTTMRR